MNVDDGTDGRIFAGTVFDDDSIDARIGTFVDDGGSLAGTAFDVLKMNFYFIFSISADFRDDFC